VDLTFDYYGDGLKLHVKNRSTPLPGASGQVVREYDALHA
jgi:hypothetical protein